MIDFTGKIFVKKMVKYVIVRKSPANYSTVLGERSFYSGLPRSYYPSYYGGAKKTKKPKVDVTGKKKQSRLQRFKNFIKRAKNLFRNVRDVVAVFNAEFNKGDPVTNKIEADKMTKNLLKETVAEEPVAPPELIEPPPTAVDVVPPPPPPPRTDERLFVDGLLEELQSKIAPRKEALGGAVLGGAIDMWCAPFRDQAYYNYDDAALMGGYYF